MDNMGYAVFDTDLFFDLQLEVAEVLLQLAFPLARLFARQLQTQLRICLQCAHAVLVLIQQMLHLLLVHLQPRKVLHFQQISTVKFSPSSAVLLIQQMLCFLLAPAVQIARLVIADSIPVLSPSFTPAIWCSCSRCLLPNPLPNVR